MTKKTEAEDTKHDEAAEPTSLVGSGVQMVTVQAKVGVFGLAVGESGNLVRSPEVEANIRTGNLALVEE